MQSYCIPNFFKLAFSHKKPGAWLLTGAGYNSDRFNSGRTHKLPEFFGVFTTVMRRKFDVDEYRSLTYIRAIKQWASTPLVSVYQNYKTNTRGPRNPEARQERGWQHRKPGQISLQLHPLPQGFAGEGERSGQVQR